MNNRNRLYLVQDEDIDAQFEAQEYDEDWTILSGKCTEALLDPFLPRMYRAKYNLILAVCP